LPPLLHLSDITRASRRLAGWVRSTPLLPIRSLTDRFGVPVLLKAENLQEGGAFKLRGATHALLAARERGEQLAGVVTFSSGNHGQACAMAARRLGLAACVAMPEDAPRVKVDAVCRQGAEVLFAGRTSDDRRAAAERIVAERGWRLVPPFDDADIVAGQGTAGLEIVRELPEVETVIVPCGGGGLLAGVATAVRLSQPGARVVGVEPSTAAKMARSLAAGTPVSAPPGPSLADGLRPSAPGAIPFALVREHQVAMTTVEDSDLLEAMARLLYEMRLVVEPSGAAGLAALEQGRISVGRGPMVVVLTGGNLDPSLLARVAAGGPPTAAARGAGS